MPMLFNAFYFLLLVLISPLIAWRAIFRRRYRKGWNEKLFGRIQLESNSDRTIWFHAVSVGELQVIRPLIERFDRDQPELRIVVSTSTDSGFELANSLFKNHFVCFAPLDFTWAIRNALNRIKPSLIVMAELELWPNWIRLTHRRRIPLAIINARLSEKSLKGYRRIAWLIRSTFRQVSWIGCQTDTYRNRFVALGCDPETTTITGNIKFDGATRSRMHPEVTKRFEQLKLRAGDLVWLVGSTQAPEESIALHAFASIATQFPQLRLIVVPRHAERFEEVAKLIAEFNIPWARRSQSPDSVSNADWRIFLADSVGELRWWWGLAYFGFVGGSFGNRGGQNMIEACAYGVATSFGPNTKNFADVVQLLLEQNAAIELSEPSDLEPWIVRMIEHPNERESISERAVHVTSLHLGAVDRTMEQLKLLLKSPVHN